MDHLSRDEAVAAAVQLQRDVILMQTNLDVLDQYLLALQGTASKLIELCLGARPFPTDEVAAGALGPRVRRASMQMEATFHESVTVPLVDCCVWTDFHTGLVLYLYSA